MLIVISGLPGTGKSSVAAQLAVSLGAVHLSVDPIENALLKAGFPASWQTGVAAYEATRAAAELNLVLGRDVVVDAVNDSEPARDTWRGAATAAQASVVFAVLTLADEVEHRRRLDGRKRPFSHVPEPSWDEVRARAATYEPWRGDAYLGLDAGRALDDLVAELVSWVTGRP